MSNRTRNHILEEKSFAFLRVIFPDAWVIHPFGIDYGIDLQIEVFDEDGKRTGIRFYGQLKGTDKATEDDVLQLDRSHFEYWAGHTDPVALFRYFDATQELQWAWLHDLQWTMKSDRSSVGVAGQLKTWNKDVSPVEIYDYLQARRSALFEPLIPPYVISVTTDSAELSAALIAANIADKLRSKSFRLLQEEMVDGHFKITVSEKSVIAMYSGLPGISLGSEQSLESDEIVGRILLALFLCACKYERLLFARAIAKLGGEILYKAAGDALHFIYFDSLIFCVGVESAAEIVRPFLAKESDSSSAWIEFLLTCAASSQRYGDAHGWTGLLRSCVEAPPIIGNVGTFSYSLGNACSQLGNWEEACLAYEKAIQHNSLYEKRPYFWTEFGTARFETGAFSLSAECYEKSLLLANDASVRWRLGDAQLHNYQFTKATKNFRTSLPELNFAGRSYVLLLLEICEDLTESWNIKEQFPNALTEQEQDILNTLSTSMDEKSLTSMVGPLLRKDALNERLNFNAGVVAARCGHSMFAAHRFLNAALMNRSDGQAWANAAVCFFNSGEAILAIATIKAAHFAIRDQFTPWILGMAPGSPTVSDSVAGSWKEIVNEVIATFESEMPRISPLKIRKVPSPDDVSVKTS